jgi:serine/threonine-protein kinase
VLVGLAAAHRAGIVHRDLKPDNIFILKEKAGKRDFCKIIDFGISKFQKQTQDGMRMTRTGMLMGTPYYMSPEQASGRDEIDHRTDLYSLGVIMFEASTGRVPFQAESFNRLLFKIALEDVPKPEVIRPELDRAFASLITKAMARDRDQRFQTADDFMKALDDWLRRGAGISVPASADPAAASLIRGRPSGELTAEPTGKTGGSWATTQIDSIPVKKKSRRGLGLALGGILVALGAGAVVALRSGSKEPSHPPETVVANVSAGSAEAPKPPQEPIVSPQASPEPTVSVATPEPAPSSTASPKAMPRAAAVGRPKAVEPKAASTASEAVAAPPPAPAPPPPPPPAPAPAPAATKARRDFGY